MSLTRDLSFSGASPSGDAYISTVSAAAPSSLLSTPDRTAASPLQRRIRHTRLFSQLSPSLPAQLPPTGTSAANTANSNTITSPRLGTSVEAMAPRTVLKSGSPYTAVLWQPTRLTSSYCVLSAAGAQEDFYTTALSWGAHQMALALEHSLVLFHPSHPRQSSSTVQITQAPADTSVYSAKAFQYPRRATAVAMSRCREISCFAGLSNGAVELYEGSGDGRLHCTVAFAMPEPPTDYLSSLLSGEGGRVSSGASASRAVRALSLLSTSVSSVGCVATSDRHPWLGAAATAALGLVALDARQTQPVLHFGGDTGRGADTQYVSSAACGSTANASALTSPLSPSSVASAGDGCSIGGGDGNGGSSSSLGRLQRASAFLRQHDRLCSVSWNSSGSLVATGSSGGIVKVWSLGALQRPLHSFLIDQECTVKALSFHPERPYELLVGGSAGPAGLRSYDLSSAEPVLTCCGATAAPITQAVFDPAGNYAVTCAGAPTCPASLFSPSAPSLRQQQRRSLSASASAARAELISPGVGSSVWEGSPRWHHSSPSHSGTGVSSAQLSAGVPLLQDSWDDMDVAAVDDTSPLITRTYGSGGVGVGGGFSSSTAHHTLPNAIVLWRCGNRCRDNYLRDALFREHAGGGEDRESAEQQPSDDNDDDEHHNQLHRRGRLHEEEEGDDNNHNGRVGRRSPHPSLAGEWRAGRVTSGVDDEFLSGGGEEGWPRSEWLPLTSLPGHRARPLLICAPFPQSPFAGCYASLAAGEDCTIRFWRLFETASDASHWQHRRQAQQRSATTQEDMDFFTTPVLR